MIANFAVDVAACVTVGASRTPRRAVVVVACRCLLFFNFVCCLPTLTYVQTQIYTNSYILCSLAVMVVVILPPAHTFLCCTLPARSFALLQRVLFLSLSLSVSCCLLWVPQMFLLLVYLWQPFGFCCNCLCFYVVLTCKNLLIGFCFYAHVRKHM